MIIRSNAIRILALALPLCAAASASTGILDPSLEDQAEGVRAKASVPSTWSEPAVTVVEVTIPPSTPGAPGEAERTLSANPLWGMPLKQFSVTRERPIFLSSRRPPAPPASAVTVAKVIVPKPKEPEQPQLSLVGTISGDDAKFGIFVDQATKNVLRLRVGENFQGWELRSIQSREASFQKSELSFVVALPQPGLSQASIAVREEARPPGSDDGKLLPVNARPRTR
jgi:general secretion pathway protein N